MDFIEPLAGLQLCGVSREQDGFLRRIGLGLGASEKTYDDR
jgi:hypothetical protein